MIDISAGVSLGDWEVELTAIRAQGAGGQNVNKVSSAVHLRFNIERSSLPEFYKQRLLAIKDSRVTKDGEIVIKAQRFRTQEKNRSDALARLRELIMAAVVVNKTRRPTRPSKGAKMRRLEGKAHRSQRKSMRSKPEF